MATKIYGIKNCNTMKKTFDFFEEKGMAYEFVDYKKTPPTPELLTSFLEQLSLDELVNRKGTTYKKLSEDEKALTQNEGTAISLLGEKSSMIKRPILVFEDGVIQAGFDEEAVLAKR